MVVFSVSFLLFIAAIFKSLADLSAEGKIPFGDPFYFYKDLSWTNKYKKNTREPKFFLSTTVLVFLTDFWHLCNFIFFTSIQLAISLSLFNGWYVVLGFICIKIVISMIMEITRRIIKRL